jgi:hypothetical protein
MKSLLLLLLCVVTLSGCASLQPQAKTPDRNRVAQDLADDKLDQAMKDLLAPVPAPLHITGQAVALDATPAGR